MKRLPKSWGLGALLCAAALLTLFVSSAAADTTLTFQEPHKGSSFHFVDVAPHSKIVNGGPKYFSPGDEIIIGQPLTQGGKRVGHLRAVCTATAAKARTFAQAKFICQGAFVFSQGSLFGFATLDNQNTEGSISGGTGIYAGAHGTFLSVEGKNSNDLTITLIGLGSGRRGLWTEGSRSLLSLRLGRPSLGYLKRIGVFARRRSARARTVPRAR